MPRMRTGHAIGMEEVEVVELLAGADELDRLAGDGAHAERGAAAGVAVELGEDDAVDVDALLELLGGVDRVLTGHGVDDEQDVVRLDLARMRTSSSMSSSSMCSRPAVSMIATSPFWRANSTPSRGDLDRVDVGAGRVDGHVDALGQRDELVDGRRPVHVGGDQHRMLAVLLAGTWPAWRRRSSCRNPAGRPCRMIVGGWPLNASLSRRRPSAP